MECKKIFKLGAILLLAYGTVTSAERTQWCDDEHAHEEEDHVHPEDFRSDIFQLYGSNETCTISEHDFEHMLEDLQIGEATEDHAPHRRKRDVHHTCYSAHKLLDIHNISHETGISEAQVVELSPALIQQIVQGCAAHEEETAGSPPPAETYGYGTVAVVLISLCAPLGLVVVRWSQTAAYKYIMATMLGLAVGTLTGDALIHLLPHGLDLHGSHEDDAHAHEEAGVESFVWKTFLSCVAIWGFFNLQMFLQIATGGHSHSHDVPSEKQPENNVVLTEMNGDMKYTLSDNKANGVAPHEHDTKERATIEMEDIGLSDDVKADKSLALMVTVGDGFHNFADGLTIGAAFTIDWQTGLSTSLAVIIHEVAHEFGDVAALLSTGISWQRVFGIQLLTQTPALVGLYIGIPIAESSEEAQQWILCLAAGMFLYIALCDIVPELAQFVRRYPPYKTLFFINIGLTLGLLIMLLIGAFEGAISI